MKKMKIGIGIGEIAGNPATIDDLNMIPVKFANGAAVFGKVIANALVFNLVAKCGANVFCLCDSCHDL